MDGKHVARDCVDALSRACDLFYFALSKGLEDENVYQILSSSRESTFKFWDETLTQYSRSLSHQDSEVYNNFQISVVSSFGTLLYNVFNLVLKRKGTFGTSQKNMSTQTTMFDAGRSQSGSSDASVRSGDDPDCLSVDFDSFVRQMKYDDEDGVDDEMANVVTSFSPPSSSAEFDKVEDGVLKEKQKPVHAVRKRKLARKNSRKRMGKKKSKSKAVAVVKDESVIEDDNTESCDVQENEEEFEDDYKGVLSADSSTLLRLLTMQIEETTKRGHEREMTRRKQYSHPNTERELDKQNEFSFEGDISLDTRAKPLARRPQTAKLSRRKCF